VDGFAVLEKYHSEPPPITFRNACPTADSPVALRVLDLRISNREVYPTQIDSEPVGAQSSAVEIFGRFQLKLRAASYQVLSRRLPGWVSDCGLGCRRGPPRLSILAYAVARVEVRRAEN